MLKLLARSLHIKQTALRGVLRALPTLFASPALDEVFEAASGPEPTAEASEAVAALLRPALEQVKQDVLPRLTEAATRLLEALELGPPSTAEEAEQQR